MSALLYPEKHPPEVWHLHMMPVPVKLHKKNLHDRVYLLNLTHIPDYYSCVSYEHNDS